jgi:hypothetical protein
LTNVPSPTTISVAGRAGFVTASIAADARAPDGTVADRRVAHDHRGELA